MSGERLHNMKAVESRTGLSAQLIRVWERRYQAVSPARSDTRRRLYSEEEVERLLLLARLTRSGFAIRNIANLSLPDLRRMQGQDSAGADAPEQSGSLSPVIPEAFLEQAMWQIREFDSAGLEKTLDQVMLRLGHSGLLERFLVPLFQNIGTEWEQGGLTASQEHGATAFIRDYLSSNFRGMAIPESAPRILITTPAGQLHDMGAAIVTGLARKAGWNVIFLGASLPAEEIAGTAILKACQVVGLSIVYPGDDPEIPGQLLRLRALLPPSVAIIIGGRSAPGYRSTIERIGATLVADLSGFTRVLEGVRRSLALPAGAGPSPV